VRNPSAHRSFLLLLSALSLLLGLPSASATVHNVQTQCGATGNGSSNDTAAINTCIGQLSPGDTLEFPAGTYLVTSLNPINVSNVTIDGSNNAATIISRNTQQGPLFTVGQSGIGWTNNPSCTGGNSAFGPASALSATANEQATTFTTTSALNGISAGGYVLLLQGGQDSSEGSGNTGCDTSGCRAELVNITNVSGNTYTVATMLHDTFNPGNAAVACPASGLISGVTLQNITFDGGSTSAQTSGNTWGVEFNDCVNCTVSGVTFQNTLGSAFLHTANYGTTFSNITVKGAGSEECGAAFQGYANSNMTFNGISLSNLNPGTGVGNCNGDGAFGLEEVNLDNSTVTNAMVNSSGAGGRPMKLTAARWTTYNSLTVENGNNSAGFNGLSLEYYSSHNTFNNCTITNNAGGTSTGSAGINSFGNFNQYNTFSGCTVSGNGNVQIYISNADYMHLAQDSNDTFVGNTITGMNGTSTQGLLIYGANACVNNNTFTSGTGLNPGISANGSGDMGSGNVLNNTSSNLSAGTCQSVTSAPGPAPTPAPMPPTGLVAVVQ